jgi:hypothetical protein
MNTFLKEKLNLLAQTLMSWNGLSLPIVLGVLLGSLGTLTKVRARFDHYKIQKFSH